MEVLLIFMYVFAFKIYSIIDSTVLVGVLLLLFFLFNKKYRSTVYNVFINYKKYFKWLFIVGFTLLAWACLVPIFLQTHDFSYIKTLIHLYLVLFVGVELFAYLKYKNKAHNIVNYVIIAFLIQSIIQFLFFLFPNISELFNVFRSQAMIELSEHYNNIRGIAITTSGFFSLSSSYGIVFLLYFTKYNTLFKNKILKVLTFLALLCGNLFAGRTGYVALLLIPFLLSKQIFQYFKTRKWKIIVDFIIVVIVFSGFIYFTNKIPRVNTVYNYSFELVKNIFTGKGIYTTSTDTLLGMYDVDVSLSTFFIGDGQYTVCENSDCSYYQNTDVGYLRKLLYFGIVGLLLSFLFQLCIFNKTIKYKENIVIFCFLLVLELKGETFGIGIMVNSILFLYTLFLLNKEISKIKNINMRDDIVLNSTYVEEKVSIIVPIFNAEKYIERTVDSFLNQTYKNLEIILVDDGSTDRTKTLLKEKYGMIDNVKIIHQKNQGAPVARNKGFKKASGKYIIFFDSDDYMNKNYLKKAMYGAQNYDLIITAFEKVNETSPDGNVVWKYSPIENLSLIENMYFIPPFPCNKILRKDIIQKHKIIFDDLKMAQDLNFYLKYLQYVENVKILDEPYIYYAVHENSVSRTYNMNLLDVERSIELASKKEKIGNESLLKLVRLKHYSTQLLKLNNYSASDGKKIIAYFKEKAYEKQIFKLDKKYRNVMKKYYIYLKIVFLFPYGIDLKINRYIKRRMGS